MIEGLSALLVPVLLLLPGYAVMPGSVSRRLRLPFVIFTSVVVTSFVSLALMAAGLFSVVAVAVIEAPLILLRLRDRSWPAVAVGSHRLVLVLWLLVALFALFNAGEPYDATGDAGVYTLAARHLADSGSWTWRLDELIVPGVSEDLVVNTAPYVRPWREIAPGFIVRQQLVVPQFLPVYAIWGAVFDSWFGLHGVLAANVLAALLLLLGWDALLRLLVGPRWRVVGLTAVVLNPVFLVFLGYPSAEAFLAGLLAGWLYWMVLFLRAPSARRSLLPAALLAVAILTKFFAWAVAGSAAIALVLLPRRRLAAALPFAALVTAAAALGWLLAAPHLENHLGQLLILSGPKIVVSGCLALVALRVVWSRVARVAPPMLGVIYAGALLWLWFFSERHIVRDLAVLSGPLVLWGSAAGLVWYVWRRRSLAHVFPAFVFVLLSVYLLLGSGDSPYYPFAARRLLPITVPASALFLAVAVRNLFRTADRRFSLPAFAAPLVGLAVLAAAVVPAAWAQRAAISVRQGEGFTAALDEIEAAIPDDTVVLATGNGWRYAPHLLLRGRPVYCLDPGRYGILQAIDGLFAVRSRVVVLADEPRDKGLLATVRERRRLIAINTSPPLTAAPIRGSTFRLFEVTGDRSRVPAIIDVGSDDHLMVAGCHRAERAEGRSFRWTGRGARVRVGSARQVRFVWSPGSHPKRPLPVSVRVDGKRVGFARLERGWHVSRWFPLPDTHDRMVIEIRTETFQPFALGRGNDRRLLGLRLDAVEVR